jgi:hypothetical protein
MKRDRLIRECLTLKGAELFLQLPDGEVIAAGAGEANLTIERPDPSRPHHAPDFSSVIWNGKLYTLTPKQRMVVCILWRAWEDGTTYRSASYLLEKAESDQTRLSQLFRDSQAWNNLIVPGEIHDGPADTYRLAPLVA